MTLRLGDTFPNKDVETTQGRLNIHKYFGDSWGIVFSHPADYTPVCTTELSRVITIAPEFAKRNVKLMALSCDSVKDHEGWSKDIEDYCKSKNPKEKNPKVPYPIIADGDRKMATEWGMIDPAEKTATGLPLTCRAVFIICPQKKLKLSILYPATTGRNFDEILRVIDSLQLTANHKVATPADWKSGDQCMVVPSVSNEEAKTKFKKGFEIKDMPSKKGYMRFTPDPSK